MTRMWTWVGAAAFLGGAVGCGSSPPAPSREDPPPAPVREEPPKPSASAVDPPGSTNPPAEKIPVPSKLEEVAASFGMTMVAGWQWAEIDRNRTRFDWSGRPESRSHEVRWSFWMKGKDVATTMPFLPSVVQSAALNLTRNKACEPFEQPAEIARIAGADRVITVCFEPAPYVTEEFRHGVLHGLVRGDVLVIVIVLANNLTGVIPLPEHIGGRFKP
jgi:hypothetical protein